MAKRVAPILKVPRVPRIRLMETPESLDSIECLKPLWERQKREQRIKRAKNNAPRVRTRSSYDAFQHNKVVLPGLDREPDFLPVGRSGLYDIIPKITEKHSLQYDVFTVPNSSVWIKKTEKWRGQRLHKAGFKKCCPDGKSSGRGCRRKGCAGCYCANKSPPKGTRWLILENFDRSRAKLIDPHGIHERGKRAGGKDHHARDKAKYTPSRPKRPDSESGWHKHKHPRW